MPRILRTTPQLFVFTYHKVGTLLFAKLLSQIARSAGLKHRTIVGLALAEDAHDADIVLFAHSLVGFDLGVCNFNGVRMVRDPRDVWVSGYLYHRHCDEVWCTNTDLRETGAPILFPQVPRSQQHRPEAWKRDYLRSLGGKSYQANLQQLPKAKGLAFELDHYAGWTIDAMTGWTPHPAVNDVAIEDLSANFDATMAGIFSHLGFSGDSLARALEIARAEDVARMSDTAIAADPHIHSRQISKWRDYLSARDLDYFAERFPDIATEPSQSAK